MFAYEVGFLPMWETSVSHDHEEDTLVLKTIHLKAPYSSKGILLSKKSLINWYIILIQSLCVAPDSR